MKIAYRVNVVAEVAGHAALLVGPASVQQIAQGMNAICVDEPLHVTMIDNGYLQADRFSWSEVSHKTEMALKPGQRLVSWLDCCLAPYLNRIP